MTSLSSHSGSNEVDFQARELVNLKFSFIFAAILIFGELVNLKIRKIINIQKV